MAAKHSVTITSPEGMTPEELQAGLASGRFKPIAPDEQVDLTKGNRFMAVPKTMMSDLAFSREGITHKIPPGAHHRLLDLSTTSVTAHAPLARSFFHQAHHFRLGFEASQHLLLMTRDEELTDQLQEYAPHPFDAYTVSFWTGTENGMAEALLMIDHGVAGLVAMEWGSDIPRGVEDQWTIRENRNRSSYTRLAWLICDTFRLLLAEPRSHTISRGGPNRHSIRKGKRVTFYSQSEITIHLDEARRALEHRATGHGRMMPVYQYRAHLCHSGGSRSCEHEWISLGGVMRDGNWIPDAEHPRDNPTWECYHCGRRRWHRRAGTRGSAEVGYVRQTYKVKKGDDE